MGMRLLAIGLVFFCGPLISNTLIKSSLFLSFFLNSDEPEDSKVKKIMRKLSLTKKLRLKFKKETA